MQSSNSTTNDSTTRHLQSNLSTPQSSPEQSSTLGRSSSTLPSSPSIPSKIARLKAQISEVEDQIATVCAKLETLPQFQNSDDHDEVSSNREDQEETLSKAQDIVAGHISMLKRYNDMRDAAMKLLEVIAEQQGQRLNKVLEDRDIDRKL